MSFLLSEITTLSQMVADDPKLQMELWSESVRADARDMNPLKDFIGSEGSGLPIYEKSDPAKGGGQIVHFSTKAPILGRGVMGSQELKTKTSRLRYGTFGVTVSVGRAVAAPAAMATAPPGTCEARTRQRSASCSRTG